MKGETMREYYRCRGCDLVCEEDEGEESGGVFLCNECLENMGLR
jgi:hypothetical protein